MGQWSLMSAIPSIRNQEDVYGHFFTITFRLKYTTSMMGQFTESPILEWKETIRMIEMDKGTWWFAEFDQFGRLPNSPTFAQWTYRYILAYDALSKGNYANTEPSRLYDKNGIELPLNTLPRVLSNMDRADAVRTYLKRKGGILVVQVTDKPGINKPQPKDNMEEDNMFHKHRILTFDCGLKGMHQRVKAVQTLNMEGMIEAHWTRTLTIGISYPYTMNTNGLQSIVAPPNVTKVVTFSGGPTKGTYM